MSRPLEAAFPGVAPAERLRRSSLRDKVLPSLSFESITRTRPVGAEVKALGTWRLGGEPPGGMWNETVRRQEEEPHRAIQGARWGYRLTGSADRAPLGADQWAD